MRIPTVLIPLLGLFLVPSASATTYDNLLAGDDAVVFSQRQPIQGPNLSFTHRGGVYDAYYSDVGTGWRWRSSPHWKIMLSHGYMEFGFSGQREFAFTALGSESGGRSLCNVQVLVNGQVFERHLHLGSWWRKYVIPSEFFTNGDNTVRIVQKPGTSMWIAEAHTSEFDSLDGIKLKEAQRPYINTSSALLLGGAVDRIDRPADLTEARGSLSFSRGTLSMHKAFFKLAALNGARDFELEFDLTCDGPADFKIGFGGGRVLRFTRTSTTLAKWMGSNFSAPWLDFATTNHQAGYRVLYQDGRLKLYHQGHELLDVAMLVNPAEVSLLTGGDMRAELQALTVRTR